MTPMKKNMNAYGNAIHLPDGTDNLSQKKIKNLNHLERSSK